MNVLLVSQCSKNALKETRRILDQFAERRGDHTWQTPITREGLDTLRRMLRRTARKNTAVACHWIRGRDHSELLWIVGDASRFNSQGAVPTNTTRRDVLRKQDENDWHTAEDIRLLAALAGLFHDLGKANRAFQKKLFSGKPMADPLRHEWVSLRLFEAFVGQDDDHGWLQRLAELPAQPDLNWMDVVLRDGEGEPHPSPFKRLPPLAQIVGWLVVSHHRLPMNFKGNEPGPKALNRLPVGILENWCGARIDMDGLSPKEQKERRQAIRDCWTFDHSLPFDSTAWQERVRRYATRMLQRERLFDAEWLGNNGYVQHMARLMLMLADHHYSSLTNPVHRARGVPDYPLWANTRRDTREPNQPLDEHLIGVEKHTGRLAHAVPLLERQLPRIARHKGFKQRSGDSRFRWQDKAYDLAASLRDHSQQQGFFGINMASTGRGKTLANGRIMYALADPIRGARFSIALGLRTLTLQTGEVYRHKLRLGPDELAVLVGGGAVRELHEHNQQILEKNGSESAEALLPESHYVHFEGNVGEGPLAAWLANTRGASALLEAPILACTIDHLMPATESTRGGHQIAPMLRLMSADLVLDEPDDFGLEDLPALTRLVHWTGLLGSRVLLSSATLPPSLVQGLFAAYAEGRRVYQQNRGIPGQQLDICTAWFDEFDAFASNHSSSESFLEAHRQWVAKRVQRLVRQTEARQLARIVSLPASTSSNEQEIAEQVAEVLHTRSHELHHQHHSTDPQTGKRVSFGLIRMANINPLVDVTRALAAKPSLPGHRLHLCCYHSQHPLLVRSNIEKRLDNLLNRQQEERIFADPELRATLNSYAEEGHLFIVLATSVAEVGRDHDYDWAIVEPSSMRSIIQLAGRVRRHRPGICQTPNIYLLDTNLKSLKIPVGQAAYCRPGFEQGDHFLLESHRLSELLTPDQYEAIDATPRITERSNSQPRTNLVDLEHDHLRAVMIGDERRRKIPVTYWWRTRAHLSGELQRIQPFRFDPHGRVRYVLLYDEEYETLTFTRIERDGSETSANHLLHDLPFECASGVNLWGEMNYVQQLEQLAEARNMELYDCTRRFGFLELPERGAEQGWDYHPALGLKRR